MQCTVYLISKCGNLNQSSSAGRPVNGGGNNTDVQVLQVRFARRAARSVRASQPIIGAPKPPPRSNSAQFNKPFRLYYVRSLLVVKEVDDLIGLR
jgi:hypothetical protein